VISVIFTRVINRKNKQNVQQNCARTLRYWRCHSPRKFQGLFTKGFNLVCSVSGTIKMDYLSEFCKSEFKDKISKNVLVERIFVFI
jgi:hypothetical protein